MTMSRSPSPMPGGGWSSPGLNMNSGRSSPVSVNTGPVAWESSKMRYQNSNGHSSFSTQNKAFFGRHIRKLSSSLPRFNTAYTDKEKPSGGHRWIQRVPLIGRIKSIFGRMGRKLKFLLLILLVLLLCTIIFYTTPLVYYWRRSSLGGGGNKFVIILAANVGGGVMEWKGAREWAIERDSVRNKKKYAARWGYDLEIVDMGTKKKYAHEWREGWAKADFIRSTLRKYPKAEWVWWLDLGTYIMEPSYSLQDHIFNDLEKHVYRDINQFNPLKISHPLQDNYLDSNARSLVGDGDINSVNMLLSQDCDGFNLGSFFVRRGEWIDQLLDVWWDPVVYEQKHIEWVHDEQDALAQMYSTQPWVRQHVGFLPQRLINSFPPGACNQNVGPDDQYPPDDPIHYNANDHDFLVSMAGCQAGRDCWGEMYYYREFGYWLNRNPWERFKEDLVAVLWFKLTGQKVKL
ncbi:galactosyl transferase GMA12/MNN10 family-domain-containing protein [Mariannaea sp. PMI_226]|nr:galactosyl transferase GMA12/MNN10 family-domain-containing protein [Mariannaea sp. PMI_226]